MNTYINDPEIRDCYNEDTVGRKYHASITTKKGIGNLKGESSEPITMNLNKPMKWKEFKQLTDSMKVMYLKHLVTTYGVNGVEVRNMLGVSNSYFYANVITKMSLTGLFGSGRAGKTAEQEKAWCKFLGEAEEPVVESLPEPIEEPIEEPITEAPTPTATVCSFKFTQSGCLNIDELVKRITAMVSEGTPCTLKVSLSVES